MTANRPTTDANGKRVDGRSLRWEKHRQQRRKQIVDAALHAIATEGPDVGVESISTVAKIPRPVVYRLFKDREELDDAIRSAILDDLLAHINPALAPTGVAHDAISNALRAYVQWVADNANIHHFLGIGSASSRNVAPRAVTGARTSIAEQISALLAAVLVGRGGDPSPAESLGWGLFGFVDSTVNRWRSHLGQPGHLSAEQLHDFLTRTVWAMIYSTFSAQGLEASPDSTIAPLGDVAGVDLPN